MKLTCSALLNILFATIIILGVVGCGSSPTIASTSITPPTTTPTLPGAKATYIYTVQMPIFGGTSQVLQFTAGANGSTTPTATLNPPTGMSISSVATDANGQIYISGYLPTSSFGVIEIYAAGATGTPPLRTITVPDLYPPTSMAIDAAGSLYTVNPTDGSLFVYSSTANGSATPTRIITGALTQLNYSSSVAVDASGNIYVASTLLSGNSATGAIYIFSSTANGNIAPIRTITNPNGAILGGTLDSAGDFYATLDNVSGTLAGSVVEYAPGATGAATPIRTISGSSTQLATAGGINVDGAGNIYVANQISSNTASTYSINEFAATATGNAAPIALLTSSSWTNSPSQFAIR